MTPQRDAIEHALTQWGKAREQVDAERDALVLGAIAIGISKNRVHVLTGIARTTVDRIAESDSARSSTASDEATPKR